ncbi:hypothetical protein VPH35_038801 [Triticum aestivum]
MIPAVPATVDGGVHDGAQSANAPLLPETSLKGQRPPARQKRPSTVLPAIAWTVLLLALAGLVVYRQGHGGGQAAAPGDQVAAAGRVVEVAASRGVVQGVSEKSTAPALLGGGAYDWTNAMLAWQRTAFHFQPQKNWMNGPLYYKGWYHLFYQWNPDGAVWGNITWGHAVSRDLVHWLHLPLAMVPDHWYDINGVWTGSATQLPDGRIMMLYTGSTEDGVQVQLLAEPADPSDPLLRRWAKSEANPVLVPPPGVGLTDFRDPTTAWLNPADKAWRIAIGSKNQEHAGLALVYSTEDFVHYDLLPTLLHVVQGTGMWECVDFYPVSAELAAGVGLDTSAAPGPGVKHVLKASLDDDRNDYYAIGTYDPATDRWAPDDAAIDVGIGLRYDYGKFYASKTFYDPVGRRRVLWGWIGESDSERADVLKGWASLQSIPRTVLMDTKTGSNLLQWPVVEVENLRMRGKRFDGLDLQPGSVVPLDVGRATQVSCRPSVLHLFVLDRFQSTNVDSRTWCSWTSRRSSRCRRARRLPGAWRRGRRRRTTAARAPARRGGACSARSGCSWWPTTACRSKPPSTSTWSGARTGSSARTSAKTPSGHRGRTISSRPFTVAPSLYSPEKICQ